MEFYILRNQLVHTPASPAPFFLSVPGLIGRGLNVPEAQILVTKNDDGTDNQKYAENLTAAIDKNPWSMANKRKVNWKFETAIYLPRPSTADDSNVGGRADQPGKLKIFNKPEDSENNLLEVLHNTFNVHGGGGHNLTLNMVVKNFGLRTRRSLDSSFLPITWQAKGLILEKIILGSKYRVIEYDCPLMSSRSPAETRMLVAWGNGEEFSGIFTVSVVLNNSALCLLNSLNQVPKEGYGHLKDMLEKEICTDLVIRAGLSPFHRAIKCHRAILAAGSTVFQKIFESGMLEARKNKIEIEDTSQKGVRALLAYLYHREIKAAYESSEVALELLKAGEKYDIQGLKDTIREFMMAKESVWFGADVVLAAYVFVRELASKQEVEITDEATQEDDAKIKAKTGEVEDEEMGAWKSLKLKCLKTLKWYFKKKPQTLLKSAKYQEILKENLNLVMEINMGICRLD